MFGVRYVTERQIYGVKGLCKWSVGFLWWHCFTPTADNFTLLEMTSNYSPIKLENVILRQYLITFLIRGRGS